MPIDYSKGQIYKLWSLDNLDMVYVGSTCQNLNVRLAGHKRSWKWWKKTGKGYKKSCDMFENCQEVKIELVEESPCENRQQLLRTEGKYIREMDCINMLIAGRTVKEYYQDNIEQMKQYYEQNKDKIRQQHKQWREANKEARNKQRKQYRQDNKEKIRQREKIKITCECGLVVRKCSIARHRRSQRHQRFIIINQQ